MKDLDKTAVEDQEEEKEEEEEVDPEHLSSIQVIENYFQKD